ncbi:MAG: hypothetical protein OHK0052_21160 [Anaerolineales bacterium]
MSEVFRLYRLQQLDSEIDKGKARLQAIAQELADKAALRAAQAVHAAAQTDLQQAQRKLRSAEASVKAQRIKIEQNQAALYGGKVRNPKELQGLQAEAEALKRHLSALEDAQLEAMLTVEEVQAAAEQAAVQLKTAEQAAQALHAALLQEQAKLQEDLQRAAAGREATLGGIPADELSLYEDLRRKRAGIAVSKVANNACSACGSSLTAVLLQAARSPHTLTRCTTCGRILYAG